VDLTPIEEEKRVIDEDQEAHIEIEIQFDQPIL